MALPARIARLEAVRSTRIIMDGVSKLRVSIGGTGKGHTGTRQFLRDFVPAIRFHNPETSLEFARFPKGDFSPPQVTVCMADGTEKAVEAGGMAAEEILKSVVDAAGGEVTKLRSTLL